MSLRAISTRTLQAVQRVGRQIAPRAVLPCIQVAPFRGMMSECNSGIAPTKPRVLSLAEKRAAELMRVCPEFTVRPQLQKLLPRLTDDGFRVGLVFLEEWSMEQSVAPCALQDDDWVALERDFLRLARYRVQQKPEDMMAGLRTDGSSQFAWTAVEEAQRLAEIAVRQQDIDSFSPTGNWVWSLHRILAGLDTFGVSKAEIKALQERFGWTLSFSRAFHGGEGALREWFSVAGVDCRQLEDQYQCFRQERVGATLQDADTHPSKISGVQVLSCSYAKGGDSVPTTLLMYAPVRKPQAGKDKVVTLRTKVQVPVPTFRPQLEGAPMKDTGQKTDVDGVPLVLTPPRIQLLLHMARGMTDDGRGVQLTGVHGAGKSLLLAALSTVLPVGHPCDMLFVPKAGALVTSTAACASQLVQSSGPLVDARAVGTRPTTGSHHPSKEVNAVVMPPAGGSTDAKKAAEAAAAEAYPAEQAAAQAQWLTADVAANTELNSWHKACVRRILDEGSSQVTFDTQVMLDGTLGRLTADYDTSCGRVYIFDEVNELINGLAAGDEGDKATNSSSNGTTMATSSPATLTKGDLRWDTAFPEYSFRVLASSPDGAREVIPRVSELVFHELRPTRFDHLAAVMYAAPHYLHPGLDKVHMGDSDKHAALRHAMHVCRTLCGNMREITLYLGKLVREHDGLRSTEAWNRKNMASYTNLLQAQRVDYFGELVRRLKVSCGEAPADGKPQRKPALPSHGPKGKVDGLPTGLFGLALMNASMGVRVKHEYDSSEFDLLGSTVLGALTDFLRDSKVQLRSKDGAVHFAAASIGDYKHFSVSGAAFENEVHKRLLMKALGARQWRLSDLHHVPSLPSLHTSSGKPGDCNLWQLCGVGSDGRTAGVLAPMEEKHTDFVKQAVRPTNALWRPAKEWQALGGEKQTTQLLVQSVADQSSFVDESVSTAVADCLQSGGRAVIRTSGNFPGVDFIHVESDGANHSITFVEATISTLQDHGKAVLPGVSLAPALRDLARLTRRTVPTAKHSDGRWWIADQSKKDPPTVPAGDGWAAAGEETPANFWLRLLGCPIRIRASTVKKENCAESKHTDRLVVELDATGQEESKSPDRWVIELDGADDEESKSSDSLLVELDVEGEAGISATASAEASPKQTWDVSVVYATCSAKPPVFSSYADLDCDFAYGVFLPDLNRALHDWVLRDRAQEPPEFAPAPEFAGQSAEEEQPAVAGPPEEGR